MAAPTPGTIIDAYRIDGTIGAGSMGEVYRAIDVGLNRKVALKLLSDKHRENPELRARFIREGRAVAAVSHPNVVQVFATGTYDGRPYIAMEFLDGVDLGTYVERNGPLDSVTAAQVLLDSASGLEAAARAGLIHRDVKPSNLVRLTDGKVKVTDFGLAKPVDPANEPQLTALGVVVGTPDYIAPEQARGDKIDERVDIYALGGTAYFLLTGVPPFRTGKPGEDKYLKVVARHLKNPAPDAKTVRPDLDAELSALARKMMEKPAAQRPTYAELHDALAGILVRLAPADASRLLMRDRSRPITIPPPQLPDEPYDASAPSASLAADAAAFSQRLIPLWAWALTVIAIAVFVVGLVAYGNRSTSSGAQPTTPTAPASPPAPVQAPRATSSQPLAPSTPPPTAPETRPAPPALPTAPAGYHVVRNSDGSPWFYVADRPVSVREARANGLREGKRASGEPTDDSPLVAVSLRAARNYAQRQGARLLTAQQWDAAMTTPGFVTAVGLFEWVDGAKTGNARKPGVASTRGDRGHLDVTFRLVKDL